MAADSDRRQQLRHLSFHGAVATVGYILSPLSWWNDAFVNIPIAYVFASLVALFWPSEFLASLVLGYWLTNNVGLNLLHRGVVGAICRHPPCVYTRKMLLKDLATSVLYTGAVALLAWYGILAPPTELLKGKR